MPKNSLIENIGWSREYAKLLEGKEPNHWYPFVKGEWYNCEVSVVHYDHPHGMMSYGWDGPHKIIVYSSGHVDKRGRSYIEIKWYTKLFLEAQERVKTIAEALNANTGAD